MTSITVVTLSLFLVVSCASYSTEFNKSRGVALSKDKGGLGAPGFSCLLVNCSLPTTSCLLDSSCRAAVLCNSECQGKTNQEACNLLCELTYGYNSSKYRRILQCMSDHGCLPVSPPDGICLANDSSTIKNLTSLSQIKGKWWILRGLNCGQRGWPAAFDYFPCQRDEFVPLGTDNDEWVDHIAYCGGRNNTCSTPILYTVANVSITKPGVMNHIYTDPPLTPQIEEWRVLSWPHPDWMLYIYCGATPTGAYAGGSVVTRADLGKDVGVIPVYVETEFRSVAKQFGFNYDEMCVSNVTNCSD